MKKEYNIKDTVWIHNGDRTLDEGRVVEIIDLAHLNEGYDPNKELYVIELKSGDQNIYEVRTWEQISDTKEGPVNLYKKITSSVNEARSFLKRVGILLPDGGLNPVYYSELRTEPEPVKKPKRRFHQNKRPNNE
jgi:hypothetical protein